VNSDSVTGSFTLMLAALTVIVSLWIRLTPSAPVSVTMTALQFTAKKYNCARGGILIDTYNPVPERSSAVLLLAAVVTILLSRTLRPKRILRI
jgi:NADH:ubiquinone oxidoreductase subunit 6 (subunit J)